MIERLAAHYPRTLAASCFVAGVILAVPVAFAGWRFIIRPGLIAELEMRERIAEGTKLVRLMAADTGKRKCMDAMMLRGRLVCLEQGGKRWAKPR